MIDHRGEKSYSSVIRKTMQTQQSSMGHISGPAPKMPASSSRILYDIPCKVCRDHSSGKHYGIFACDGCAGFFKRSIRRNRKYVCKAKAEGGCMVDKTHRNQCRACRLAKCIQAGMNKDAVQHERGPRNSTLRRQMALYFKEPELMNNIVPPPTAALDLALPKPSTEPRVSVAPSLHHHHHHHHSALSHPIYCNSMPGMNKVPVPSSGIPTIPMIPAVITAESICEQAARLLFLNIHWARELATGTNLVMEDQLTLVESSWRELFLLAAAQMLPNLDPTPLLPPGPSSLGLAVEVNRFRETLAGFHRMKLDQHEFACIRAIVLFKAGLDSDSSSKSDSSNNRLRDPMTVARLRDGARLALGQRLSGTSFGVLRFGELLLLLPTLRFVSTHAIQELFFSRTIGIIPIETIICDMYKSSRSRQRDD